MKTKFFRLIGQCALLKDARLRRVIIKSIVYRRRLLENRFICFCETAVLFYMGRVAPLWAPPCWNCMTKQCCC